MPGEIEEFLRRAAQRRAAAQPAPVVRPPQQPARRQPEIQILGDDDVLDADIVDADIVEDPGILTGSNVGDHVARHINTADFGERLSHLGEEVDHADERMESHLQGYFEHALGDLGATTSRATESTLDPDPAAPSRSGGPRKRPPFNIRRLLRSPTSIRDAIVLSEILRKPEDRW